MSPVEELRLESLYLALAHTQQSSLRGEVDCNAVAHRVCYSLRWKGPVSAACCVLRAVGIKSQKNETDTHHTTPHTVLRVGEVPRHDHHHRERSRRPQIGPRGIPRRSGVVHRVYVLRVRGCGRGFAVALGARLEVQP